MKHPHELWGALPHGIREFATKMVTGAVLGAATAGLYHLMGTAQAQEFPKTAEPSQGRWTRQEHHRSHRHRHHHWNNGR